MMTFEELMEKALVKAEGENKVVLCHVLSRSSDGLASEILCAGDPPLLAILSALVSSLVDRDDVVHLNIDKFLGWVIRNRDYAEVSLIVNVMNRALEKANEKEK